VSPKKTLFCKVDKAKHTIYKKKAQDFYEGMLLAYTKCNWHSVGLEAIHCAISVTDAILVYKNGIRCTSSDHCAIISLMIEHINDENIKKYADILLKIINMKNLVEYEDRLFTEKEAQEILKRAERYYQWAMQFLL